jgi:hypothetical protein
MLQACGGGSSSNGVPNLSNEASNINSPEDGSIKLLPFRHGKWKQFYDPTHPTDPTLPAVPIILKLEFTGTTMSISLDCDFLDGTYIKGNKKLTYPIKPVSGVEFELQESVRIETTDNEGNSCFQFINKGILQLIGTIADNENHFHMYHLRDGKQKYIGTFEREK